MRVRKMKWQELLLCFLAQLMSSSPYADSLSFEEEGDKTHTATPGVHTVKFEMSTPISVGSVARGKLLVTNSSEQDDIVRVIVIAEAKRQNGYSYHTYFSQEFSNINILAGASEVIPFSIALPLIDNMVFNADFITIGVVVLGNIGNGFGVAQGTVVAQLGDVSVTASLLKANARIP